MAIRRLPCPSCGVGLKVADTVPVGKKINCPKCGVGFGVPGEDDEPDTREAVAARPRRAAPPPDDEDDDDREREVERRPRKKRRKKKKAASNMPLILGLVIGAAVLLIGAAVVLAVVRPWEQKTATVATNNPTPSRPETSATRVEPRPGLADTRQPGGETLASGSGKQIYDSLDCSRCHSIGGSLGGGKKKRGPGPDLSRVGANPSHTVEWISEPIRNPRSHRANSRMPGYEEKISREELRSLAEYLASLK
jgi:mono/diheme cytochrome c family protein/Zn-finger nucleic acid-binding protein